MDNNQKDISFNELYKRLANFLNYFNKEDSAYTYIYSILVRKSLDGISLNSLKNFLEKYQLSDVIKDYISKIIYELNILLEEQITLNKMNVATLSRINKIKDVASNKGIDSSNFNFTPVTKFNSLSEMKEYEKELLDIFKQLDLYEQKLGIVTTDNKPVVEQKVDTTIVSLKKEEVKNDTNETNEPNVLKIKSNINIDDVDEVSLNEIKADKLTTNTGKAPVSVIVSLIFIVLLIIAIVITFYMIIS